MKKLPTVVLFDKDIMELYKDLVSTKTRTDQVVAMSLVIIADRMTALVHQTEHILRQLREKA